MINNVEYFENIHNIPLYLAQFDCYHCMYSWERIFTAWTVKVQVVDVGTHILYVVRVGLSGV